jgi:predicted nucleic acid-binding protein
MTKKAFVDSDVIIDVATGRLPFFHDSKVVLTILEHGFATGYVSSNIVTNVYYVLRKISSNDKAKVFLASILKYLTVISVDHRSVIEALGSDFGDFEDAVQHFSALANSCDCIITRNVEDYKGSEVPVMTPFDFVGLFGPSGA